MTNGSRTLYAGQFITLHDWESWEFVSRPASHGVVFAVAQVENSILLVEQFRPAYMAQVIGLPGGIVEEKTDDPDADMIAAAHRELLEETGFTAKAMRKIVTGSVAPSSLSGLTTLFVAEGVEQKQDPTGDGDENLILHRVPLDQALAWLETRKAEGAVVDLLVYLGLSFLGVTPA